MKKEIFDKLKTVDSVEDVMTIAKEDGKELTVEQAQSVLNWVQGGGELSDDDLDEVSGGGSDFEYVDPWERALEIESQREEQRRRFIEEHGRYY